MSLPDSPHSHSLSQLCSRTDYPSEVGRISPSLPVRSSRSIEIANVSHTPHTMRPIIEVGSAVSPDSDSEDEATSKLKTLIEHQAGTRRAGNRDTIDSILSKYSYELETEQTDSRLDTEIEAGTDPGSNASNQYSTQTVDNLERGLELILAPEIRPTQTSPQERSQALKCPHCDENFYFTQSENKVRDTAIKHDETASDVPLLFAGRTDSAFESSDALRASDSSRFVAEDTTLSTFNHGTVPPSDTKINEASDYSPRRINHSVETEGYKPTADTHTQNEVSLRGSRRSSEKKNLMSRAFPQDEAELEPGNVDEEVGRDDFNHISMLLCNLNDVQDHMDNLLAHYPLPPSAPKNSYVSAQISADTAVVIELSNENKAAVNDNDATRKKEIGDLTKPVDCEKINYKDNTPRKKGVEEALNSAEAIIAKTAEYKTSKYATQGLIETLDGNLGAELLLIGVICTMCGLVFAVGVMST